MLPFTLSSLCGENASRATEEDNHMAHQYTNRHPHVLPLDVKGKKPCHLLR